VCVFSGMSRRLALVRTDVSEELSTNTAVVKALCCKPEGCGSVTAVVTARRADRSEGAVDRAEGARTEVE
jgi:hypothetical protein